MSGHLATVFIDGTTNTVDTPILLYTLATSSNATLNMRTINNTGNEAIVKTWFIPTAVTPADDVHLFSPETTLPSKGLIEDTAIAFTIGNAIYVQSNIVGVSFKVYGHVEQQP